MHGLAAAMRRVEGCMERVLIYGAFGWCAEIVWTAAYELVADLARNGRVASPERWRLTGRTYLWMFPLYGAGGLLFEPCHEALRAYPWPLRGLVWMLLIFAVEYVSGAGLRRLTGLCPWDYSYARCQVHGLIRLDYAPVWFLFGLLLERVHDIAVRITTSHAAL